MINSLPKSLVEDAKYLLESEIYESLLLENRIQFLKDKNPTIDTSHDQLAIFSHPHEIIDHFSNVGDPTKNKQHTQWILNQYKKQNIRQEDMGRVRGALENFEKYKGKLDKKDINQYKTLSDVESAVHPHVGTAATKSEATKETLEKGRTLIHSSDGLKVYRLEPNEAGRKASQEIYGGGHESGGTHTSWCTAARSEYCMFDHYSKEEPLHVIHTKDGSVYQAHPSTNQLMDAADEEVTGEVENENRDYVPHKHAKEISKALDHIPNGWKLKVTKELPGVSSSDLQKAASSESHSLYKIALLHPKVDENTLIDASISDDGTKRSLAAQHPNLPKGHLRRLFALDKSSLVRNAAVSNPQWNADELEQIYNDNPENENIRREVVRHPNISQKLMRKASEDVYSDLVTEHPKADADTLRHAVSYGGGTALMNALNHKNVPHDILEMGLKDSGWQNQYAQIAAVQSPKMTPDLLHKAMNSSIESVRSYALNHSNTDNTHVARGLQDESHIVREAAASNPNITSDQIHHILDADSTTRTMINALKNKKATTEHVDKAALKYPENSHLLDAAISSKKLSPKMQDWILHGKSEHIRPRHISNVILTYKPSLERISHLENHPEASVRSFISDYKEKTK